MSVNLAILALSALLLPGNPSYTQVEVSNNGMFGAVYDYYDFVLDCYSFQPSKRKTASHKGVKRNTFVNMGISDKGVLAISDSGGVKLFGPNGKSTKLLNGRALDGAGDLDFSPGGKYLLVKGGNRRLVYQVADGRLLLSVSGQMFNWEPDPSWSPDGNSIAYIDSGRRSVHSVNLVTGKKWESPTYPEQVRAVAIDNDPSIVYTVFVQPSASQSEYQASHGEQPLVVRITDVKNDTSKITPLPVKLRLTGSHDDSVWIQKRSQNYFIARQASSEGGTEWPSEVSVDRFDLSGQQLGSLSIPTNRWFRMCGSQTYVCGLGDYEGCLLRYKYGEEPGFKTLTRP
jgi:hypothetical protein